MHMRKKATVAAATVGILTVLGAGMASANDQARMSRHDEKPRGYDKKPVTKVVEVDQLDQQQTCSQDALISVNILGGGGFKCTQKGSVR